MHSSSLGSAACLAALLVAAIPAGIAQISPIQATRDEILVEMVPATGIRNAVNFGPVSFNEPQSERHRNAHEGGFFTVKRPIRLRAAKWNGQPGRAILRAYLARDCFPTILKIDGIALSTTAKIIAHEVQLNRSTEHILELQVPVTAPAGAFDAQIGWQAEEK
jgi:hypothetical protein